MSKEYIMSACLLVKKFSTEHDIQICAAVQNKLRMRSRAARKLAGIPVRMGRFGTPGTGLADIALWHLLYASTFTNSMSVLSQQSPAR